MGQADRQSGDYDIVQAARLRRKQRQTALPVLIIRGVRSVLSNEISTRLLRLAHKRAAPLRLFVAFLVTVTWVFVGGWAAFDFGKDSFSNPSVVLTEDAPEPYTLESGVRAVSNAVCVFRNGEPCKYQNYDTRIVAGQTALTILALITLFFGFWRQLFASAAKAFRYIGARHVIVTGDTPEAQALALSVASKKAPRRRAIVLVRKSASSADIESLGAEGVTVLVGNPSDKSVLLAAGARDAYKIVALSDSDAENIATAATFKRSAGAEPGRIAVRLESHDLRRDMPTHGQFGGADAFSLAEISARVLMRSDNLLNDAASTEGATSVHVAILGWDGAAAAVAERTLRMMWAPGLGAPRVTVFAPDAAGAEKAFKARFPLAFGDPDAPEGAPIVWTADIAFKPYEWRAHKNAWLPLQQAQSERGAITSVVVSYPSDDETLHCAALLAGKRDKTAPTIYVRDDENGTTGVVLSAYETDEVRPFARHTDILSASALVDRTIDKAAKQVHETYFESSVFYQGDNQKDYVRALTTGRALNTRIGRIFRGAPKNLPEAPEERLPALEHDFQDVFGERAFATLRSRLAEDLAIKGLFTPKTPASLLWEDLHEQYVENNRAAADHAVLKLRSLGWRPAVRKETGFIPSINGADISDAVAEVEHNRWCADKIMAGWRFGPRDDAAMTHPDLKPYSAFEAPKRAIAIRKDRDNWVNASTVAAWAHPKKFVRIDG